MPGVSAKDDGMQIVIHVPQRVNEESVPGHKMCIRDRCQAKMSLNSSGLSCTGRCKSLGNLAGRENRLLKSAIDVYKRQQPGSDVIVCAEMDEQWGYVGAKSRQRWLFYAYDRLRKTCLLYTS